MINKKLIHFNTYSAFEANKSLLYDWTIVFIGLTKQIYTHGNFYDCDIEDINELNNKIDEILAELYVPIENGVYIAASDGTLTTEANWDGSKTAVGVAVIDDAANFIIGLNHTTSIPWGTSAQGLYTDISGLTNYIDSTSAGDMDGVANTDVITAIYSGTDCAAGLAKSQSITYGSDALTGYLGSAGEWLIVLNNHEAVKSAVATAGGTAFQTTSYLYYWTSTEYSSGDAWLASWRENNSLWYLDYLSKSISRSNNCVVPFYKTDNKVSLTSKINNLNVQAVDTSDTAEDIDINYLTTSTQSLTDTEKEQVQTNIGLNGAILDSSGTIQNVQLVTELPSSPSATTLYLIAA